MKHGNRKILLVVDDDATNRLVVHVLMQRRGYSVIEAPSGQDALDIVDLNEFDVILMDLSMPRMDGFEATKRLREGNKIAQSIPIFALTAHTARETLQRCLDSGMNGLLHKPFDSHRADQLLSLLNNTTDQWPG